MTQSNFPAKFESGVSDYFKNFSHRQAREVVHQSWLLSSVARHIDPQLVVGELMFPNRDLTPFAQLEPTDGAIRFDFAITNTEIDLRHWKVRTPGWTRGVAIAPQTLETLKEAAESASTAGCASSRPPASLRHSLQLLYHLEQLIHPARLTWAMDQIE